MSRFNNKKGLLLDVIYLGLVFSLTFWLIYLVVSPLFNSIPDRWLALKISLVSTAIYLIILLMRRFSNRQVQQIVSASVKEKSLWQKLSAQVILYLMIILTVYSFFS